MGAFKINFINQFLNLFFSLQLRRITSKRKKLTEYSFIAQTEYKYVIQSIKLPA